MGSTLYREFLNNRGKITVFDCTREVRSGLNASGGTAYFK